MARKNERSRYDLIAEGFSRVGVRLYRLEDGGVTQRPADQYGFVLGFTTIFETNEVTAKVKRKDAGKLVFVETKEVINKKDCVLFSKTLFGKFERNQKLSLVLAARNGCHCLVAVYCQEDRNLYIWKINQSFQDIGEKPAHLICPRVREKSLNECAYSEFIKITIEQLNSIGMCVPIEDTKTLDIKENPSAYSGGPK